MSAPRLDSLLSRMSSELILVCDDQLTVREANAIARSTLGERILGQPLIQLSEAMARAKGAAFIEALQQLNGEAPTAPWELLLRAPRAAPLLVSMRGARRPEGGWVIIGSSESPQLTRLYHEVLSLNRELTDLIRQLTREQAGLTATVRRLLHSQETPDADQS